ncbi:PREDICTED: putative V-set and immunoglobulin domain-containing-like protein IGHV4OR15-8 [Thamnophis sirtalis]|uniref:putative V-set and immunoglobulin domain-containing-like protein IGHV4OR15-8 n=1 Tax=Thamnophis sirtalis TaxID=35019 RepID=UPI0006B19A43|nr:PREDICTED: putative V-set and immunoglobulin domain-containing-like protein IGHV4OR15-8 [Thamnophis sirtalis]
MTLWFLAVCFTALPKWVFAETQLAESGPGTAKPGSQLNLVCKVTGFSIGHSLYEWHWVRQPRGKGLEWLSAINANSGSKWYANSVKSRITTLADRSRNEFSLQLNSLTAADSSVYFCARELTV